MANTSKYKRNLYGRKKSRPLGLERQAAVDALMPKLEIPRNSVNKALLTPSDLFPVSYKELWMEIGFGNGEHLAELMRRHKNHAYIGCEPFENGMASFLKEIQDEPHDHVRVWTDDGLLLADALPDHCLEGIYILNPDPWPKKRHNKRRIINHANLDRLSRVMKPGSDLIITTDVADLADWMITKIITHPDFTWTAQKADNWRRAPDDWIPTHYETKGIAAGRQQVYLFFKRK